MQTDDLAIRVQPLGGAWETLGADRFAGIVPENFTATANEWGPDTASFDLRRDPGSPHLDLMAYTPLEAEIAGELVWSGRTLETPARDGDDPQINVQAQGWQYHLDDDQYAQAYAHTRIGEWRDLRTFPGARLTQWVSACQVSNDNGVITLASPANVAFVNGTGAAVALDLGAYARAQRLIVAYDYVNPGGNTGVKFQASASNTTADDPGGTSLASVGLAASGNGTIAVNAAGVRYITLSLLSLVGANITPATDIYVRITSIQAFSSTAWESANASILRASDVVKDAVAQAAMLLTDTSQVQTSSFFIPDLHFEDTPQSPREVITAVNALHNYITKVDADQRIVFAPRPVAPLYEIGAWGGADFQDTSAGSGADIYARVLVTGTGPDGAPIIIDRTASQQPGAALTQITTPAPDNPSFAVDASSWTNVTRDTGTFDTAPASGAVAPNTAATETFTGTFKRGVTYLLRFAFRRNSPFGLTFEFTATLGVGSDVGIASFYSTATFRTYSVAWTPTADRTGVTFTLAPGPSGVGASLWVDSLILFQATPTIVERRGFRRTKTLPVNAALDNTVAAQLGDVYLQGHATQPLKGNVNALPTGVRRVAGGDVHPAHLLRETGQRLRLSHRIDPDTGGQGRDGMIATVAYNHNERTAAIALDEDRRNFDVLLARFAALSPP